MMGSEHNPGVIPLAMADDIKTFPQKEFLLRVSYMEIYNETVTDLLCNSLKRRPLEIREGNCKNVYVADLTEEMVTSPEQALSWITKGEKNRHYGKTKMNQHSSRSHTIFRMILESRDRGDPATGENADGAIIVSHLNLVDLAGAERASQMGADGARFKEDCNINRSLFTLSQVIKKLSDETQKGFLNYRDGKLTRILQNSLGGNAKTMIICTIMPAVVDETVSDEGALLKRYRNEIVELKRRLQEVSSITKTNNTERELLCQLLQEKDQLQREQEDRFRNLRKLLVTSNVSQGPTVPKRRVTWGVKLFKGSLCKTDTNYEKRRADYSLPKITEANQKDIQFASSALDEPDMSNLTEGSLLCNVCELQKLEAQEQESVLELERWAAEKRSAAVLKDTCQQLEDTGRQNVQFWETVSFNRDAMIAERDLMKHSLESLRTERDSQHKDLEKRRDTDKFEKLEEESKRAYKVDPQMKPRGVLGNITNSVDGNSSLSDRKKKGSRKRLMELRCSRLCAPDSALQTLCSRLYAPDSALLRKPNSEISTVLNYNEMS